ncbi:MAG: DNA alkylation repair protein [Dehalococcoidia bacterium]|nr:DNA alkylation repair protein [Dehalococcoidia bacterium]
MPRADRALIEAVRAGLRAAADPARAPQMQAYMKSTMPFYGVPSPVQRPIFRAAFAAHPLEDFAAWHDTLLALWREATHREERYAALALADAGAYRRHLTWAAMPLLEEFVVTGAWWDLVDETAKLIGEVLRGDRARMIDEMRRWSHDPLLWKRRVAIICQLRFKAGTDLDLLHAAIEANLDDRDFFIRKAIGWSLREYAKTDVEDVRRYVRAHAAQLSGLSVREALKNIGGPASIAP